MKPSIVRWGALALAAGALALSGCYTPGYATYAYDGYYDGYYDQYSNDYYGTSGYPGTAVDFTSSLAPYGDWVYVNGIGQCWRPYASVVGSDFVPYSTGGNWVYTNAGWAFQSAYPFGWATFHYGRWAYLGPGGGWVWAPGYQWAPAWVDWRYGGGYVGWAPLAPVGFSVGFGVGVAAAYTFVPVQHFGHHDFYRYHVPPSQYHVATAATHPAAHAPGEAHIAGPSPAYVQNGGGTVPRAPIEQIAKPPPTAVGGAGAAGTQPIARPHGAAPEPGTETIVPPGSRGPAGTPGAPSVTPPSSATPPAAPAMPEGKTITPPSARTPSATPMPEGQATTPPSAGAPPVEHIVPPPTSAPPSGHGAPPGAPPPSMHTVPPPGGAPPSMHAAPPVEHIAPPPSAPPPAMHAAPPPSAPPPAMHAAPPPSAPPPAMHAAPPPSAPPPAMHAAPPPSAPPPAMHAAPPPSAPPPAMHAAPPPSAPPPAMHAAPPPSAPPPAMHAAPPPSAPPPAMHAAPPPAAPHGPH